MAHLGCTRRGVIPFDSLEVEAGQVVQGGGTHAGDGDVQGAQASFQAADNEGEGGAFAAGNEAEMVVAEAFEHDEVCLADLGVGHDVGQGDAQRHLQGDVQGVLSIGEHQASCVYHALHIPNH